MTVAMNISDILFPSPEDFKKIVLTMASSDLVKDHVARNHDNNRWWPTSVSDWRVRMLVAGVSTRVSYAMVNTYARVVEKLDALGYERLKIIDDSDFKEIVKPIGLSDSRLQFKKSLFDFIEEVTSGGRSIDSYSSSELIALMEQKVDGAGYKVAQCCVLYARGYYCGIMPVDSGMKDNLGYCLGFNYPNKSLGHEVLRSQFEHLVKQIDFSQEVKILGYDKTCQLPTSNYSWWVHLVLIYYKRFYCNKCNPETCLVYQNRELKIGSMCREGAPRKGGTKNVIIEGVDGVGKSTLGKRLKEMGFTYKHFEYNREATDLYAIYKDFLLANNNKKIAFDRSFISEYVYGHALRGSSRISKEQLLELISLGGDTKVIIMTDTKENILSREIEPQDIKMITENYEVLNDGFLDLYNDLKETIDISIASFDEVRYQLENNFLT
ncbi:MAG: hypothetical protein JST90_17425 [Bacteroidetes bacterium]|nr:hypothetical protein [Bacteroidota bacterium]